MRQRHSAAAKPQRTIGAYHNLNGPRPLVEKPNGLGWTFNLAWVFTGLLVLLTVLIALAAIHSPRR